MTSKKRQEKPLNSLFAGTLAGAVEGFVTYPTEYVKVSIQKGLIGFFLWLLKIDSIKFFTIVGYLQILIFAPSSLDASTVCRISRSEATRSDCYHSKHFDSKWISWIICGLFCLGNRKCFESWSTVFIVRQYQISGSR